MPVPSKAPPVYKPALPRVSAPPVYQPQQKANASLQPKPAGNFRLESRPAPPVYHPQPTRNPGVQPKAAGNFKREAKAVPQAYRPQHAAGPVAPVQTKTVRPSFYGTAIQGKSKAY